MRMFFACAVAGILTGCALSAAEQQAGLEDRLYRQLDRECQAKWAQFRTLVDQDAAAVRQASELLSANAPNRQVEAALENQTPEDEYAAVLHDAERCNMELKQFGEITAEQAEQRARLFDSQPVRPFVPDYGSSRGAASGSPKPPPPIDSSLLDTLAPTPPKRQTYCVGVIPVPTIAIGNPCP